MEDVQTMTVIKERIDRLTEELELTDQKITFLEQSLEKAREAVQEIRGQKDVIEQETAILDAKVRG